MQSIAPDYCALRKSRHDRLIAIDEHEVSLYSLNGESHREFRRLEDVKRLDSTGPHRDYRPRERVLTDIIEEFFPLLLRKRF